MKLLTRTSLPHASEKLDTVVTKHNGWYAIEDFKLFLRREREREQRTGWVTAFVSISLPNYQKRSSAISNRSYDRFLAQFIGIIANNTRDADIKAISDNYRISLLLVDTSMDQAKQFIDKISKILSEYFKGENVDQELQLLQNVLIASYALSSIDNGGEVRGDAISLKHFRFQDEVDGPAPENGKLNNATPADDSFYFNWGIFSASTQPSQLDPALTAGRTKQSYHTAYPFLKRCVDIIGSLVGILLFLPLMVLIGVLVKFTSKGPMLFKQKRIGYRGEIFTFLKFRSMRTDMDDSIHREYVTKLIEGKNDQINNGSGEDPVYKITHDPRITKIGGFLRKTSLDEIPQFFNVLSGKMSLVGPRPPIPYEVDMYEDWHLRRIMEAKPGITGLWQVYGRNQTTFDEMVRLDLQYIKKRSILLDLKLILQTITVLFNPGAGL
ncbi:MAG: sugar transferase [Calditrichia bacterium]